MTDKLLNKKEIADLLSVSTSTIDRCEKDGMPVFRPPKGGQPKYDKDAVMKWMDDGGNYE